MKRVAPLVDDGFGVLGDIPGGGGRVVDDAEGKDNDVDGTNARAAFRRVRTVFLS